MQIANNCELDIVFIHQLKDIKFSENIICLNYVLFLRPNTLSFIKLYSQLLCIFAIILKYDV